MRIAAKARRSACWRESLRANTVHPPRSTVSAALASLYAAGGLCSGNALFDLVAARNPEADEATFVDAVGRNLRAGRFLLLVAGDGIREGTENIVQFMQDHSGMRFTFGLVEMAGYALPDGRLLVQPRVLARTTVIERTVVRVVEPAADLAPVVGSDAIEEGAAAGDATTQRRKVDPAFLAADRRFWDRLAQTVTLDDPSQPPPRRRGVGWARYDLGTSDAWIVAYRAGSLGLLGTYIVFRGEGGARLLAALEPERAQIEETVKAASPEAECEWGETAPDQTWLAMRLRVPGPWSETDEAKHLDWLARVGNAFVNAFRPRLQRLAAGEA